MYKEVVIIIIISGMKPFFHEEKLYPIFFNSFSLYPSSRVTAR